MHITQPVRPQEAINRLLSALEPHATPMNAIARKKINWDYKGKPQLYLFMKGEISMLRASDGLLIVTVYDAHLFGIAEMMQPMRTHVLRAEVSSELLRIDAEDAIQVLREQNLWEEVTILLSYHTAYLTYRDALVLQQRTYSVIRNHLLEMILLPEETRMRTSMLDYIQDRTHLSRSSVLNVLSALKKGKYIQFIRGGYLQHIETLPEKF
ncbi:MAG: helix-turn-helix domain-containing protein [Scandinavium sp.]|uniref:winged helix-turn-helix transcriptional regulator n=1 Tax=Scandinavium sp. TaxID=2830653 RepID=UPI003F32B71C